MELSPFADLSISSFCQAYNVLYMETLDGPTALVVGPSMVPYVYNIMKELINHGYITPGEVELVVMPHLPVDDWMVFNSKDYVYCHGV